MAFLVKDNSLRNLTGINSADSINNKSNRIAGQINFNDLLKDCLNDSGIPITNEALPLLDKDKLALIVKNIQIQMNRQLFNAVFNNGQINNVSSPNFLPDYTKEIVPTVDKVSENRQIAPKNDANKSTANLDSFINRAARKYDVDPDLIRSVIKAESNFDSRVTSSKGAMGLMQLMPETAKDLGVKNAFDPEENIMGGTRYLKSLLDRYNGKTDVALAAYNWGMGNVEKNYRQLPRETSTYISRVNSYYRNFKEIV